MVDAIRMADGMEVMPHRQEENTGPASTSRVTYRSPMYKEPRIIRTRVGGGVPCLLQKGQSGGHRFSVGGMDRTPSRRARIT